MTTGHESESERARLAALHAYGVLDGAPDPGIDALAELAAHIAQTPMALVSLVDARRECIKGCHGITLGELPRAGSLGAEVVLQGRPLLVPDIRLDARFAESPLVTSEPHVRFYFGVPLRSPEGHVLGTLCALDRTPRQLTDTQQHMITLLAQQVIAQLELHKLKFEAAQGERDSQTFRRFFELSPDLLCTASATHFEHINPAWQRVLGWSAEELLATPFLDFLHPEDVARTDEISVQVLRDQSSISNVESRFRHKDGHWVPLSWVTVARSGLFYSTAHDLSEMHERQRALQRSLAEASEVSSRLQSVLASASYLIIEVTPDGTIREFNLAAERALGYRAEEVVGKATPAFIHVPSEVIARAEALSLELGEPIPPGVEVFVAKARRGLPDEQQWTFVRRDGTRFPAVLSISGRFDEHGQVQGFVGIAMDMTARKLAEDRVRESDLLLSTVFSTMADAVIIVDEQGVVREANAAAGRILELPKEQLLGVVPPKQLWTFTRPDGTPIPEGERPAQITLRTGQPCSDVVIGLSRAGRARKLINVNCQAIALGTGRSTKPAALLTFRDITHQAQVELALRESEVRSRAIIQTAADAIITIDERGEIDRVNPAVERLFGYAPHELVGKNVSKLMPTPDHEQHDRYLANYTASGKGKVIGIGREVVARRKDGSTFPADLTVSEFFVAGQRYFTGVVRDISDRKRVERLQAEFISTVSHELRTPLTSIRGSLGLMAGGILGELPKEAKAYVEIALSNCQRLVRLINDILDIEKMREGSIDFRLQPVELAAAVRGALSANEAYATAHQTRLVLVGDLPDGEVLVDADRLAQALANLISNAVKFSPAGGSVELSVERIEGAMRVSVRDHGPGIPTEFEPRIFQRFAQADGSNTRSRGGTGLGLSITKSIIETMKGKIAFSSAPGGGALFYFDLPCLQDADGESFQRSPTTGLLSAAASEAPARLLHVESDPDLRRIVQKTLPENWQFVGAESLALARQSLEAGAFDVVLLEPSLPDGDGADLIAATGDAQVILFSALDLPAQLRRRVSAALVKSRSTPVDVRNAVLSALSKAQRRSG